MTGLIPGIQTSREMETGPTRVQRELRIVQLLLDISQALNRSLDLEAMMAPILGLIFEYFGRVCSSILLVDSDTGVVDMEMAQGFSNDRQPNACSSRAAAIARKAVETGVPVVVKALSRASLIQNRPASSLEACGDGSEMVSFLSVPIHDSDGVLGALSAGGASSDGSSIDDDVRLLMTIAPLLAQAIKIRREASERERLLQEENSRLQSEILDHFKPANIVGSSHAIRQVCRLINRVASSQACVLIAGESGVGKELVAEAIHVNSPRAGKPFLTLNLAALPEHLIDSELFGHSRNASPGAAERRGQIEMADGGTLFLDEVSRLPMATQVRLLHFLQEKAFERPGGNSTIRADTRIISATVRNLEDLTRNFQFRQDLYYRLSVFPIFVPPLRERKTDILLLANHLAERAAKKQGKAITRISASAADMLMSYHWPGNIQELESCMERAVLMSSDGVIHAHFLPLLNQTAESTNTRNGGTLQVSLDALEAELIVDALRSADGDVARAALALGITKKLMRLRIAKYAIDPQAFRAKGA